MEIRLHRVQRWNDVAWLRWCMGRIPVPLAELVRSYRTPCASACVRLASSSRRSAAFSDCIESRSEDLARVNLELLEGFFSSSLGAIYLRPDCRRAMLPVHEFAHVLDLALGFPSERLSFRGKPLDEYAALHPHERFAQAFTAWLWDEREPTEHYLHTRLDVRRDEPDLAAFIEQLNPPA